MKKWLRYIWEDETWIIKFFLLIVFAFNLGLPQGFVDFMRSEGRNKPTATYKEEIALKHFLYQKVDLAQQKMASGNFYSPYDYFQDLADYYARKKELGVSDGFSPEINRLMDFVQSSINRGLFTNRDIEKARKSIRNSLIPAGYRAKRFKKISRLWDGTEF